MRISSHVRTSFKAIARPLVWERGQLARRDIAKNSSGRNMAAMRRNYLTVKLRVARPASPRDQHSTMEASPHGQVGKSLCNVWRTFLPCSLLLLGPELLSPGLQGQVPCEVGAGSCADAKVVWLFDSGDRQVKSAPRSYAIPPAAGLCWRSAGVGNENQAGADRLCPPIQYNSERLRPSVTRIAVV